MYKQLGKIPIDGILAKIRDHHPDLYEAVRRSRNRTGKITLNWELAERLDNFLDAQVKKDAAAAAKAQAKKDAAEAATAKLRAEFQDFNKRAAIARMEFYASDQGLERSEANAALVEKWLSANRHGWSVSSVDAAISNLRGQLSWVKEPPAAPKPKPVVWSPGMPLPPNATEAMLRRSTPQQIREWLKTKNKQ
jgi:hypothetical protein